MSKTKKVSTNRPKKYREYLYNSKIQIPKNTLWKKQQKQITSNLNAVSLNTPRAIVESDIDKITSIATNYTRLNNNNINTKNPWPLASEEQLIVFNN